MKKLYTFIFAAMFALAANAQEGLGGLVLDSTYTTDGAGIRISKVVYEYNAAKKPVVNYSYAYGDEGDAVLQTRTVFTYDAQDREEKEETFDAQGTLISVIEYSEWGSSDIMPVLTTVSQVDPENPSAGLQPSGKSVVKKFNSDAYPEDIEEYLWEGGQWTLMGTMHCEYAATGQPSKSTISMDYEGMPVNQVVTYEYDSHGEPVKETSSMQMMGMDLGTTVITHENEYYADGNLKKVTTTSAGQVTIEYYFWGTGSADAVHVVRTILQRANDNVYTMSGQIVNRMSKPGMYIVGGKKVMVK